MVYGYPKKIIRSWAINFFKLFSNKIKKNVWLITKAQSRLAPNFNTDSYVLGCVSNSLLIVSNKSCISVDNKQNNLSF